MNYFLFEANPFDFPVDAGKKRSLAKLNPKKSLSFFKH